MPGQAHLPAELNARLPPPALAGRLKRGYIYRYRGANFISLATDACCMYMITQAMLYEAANTSAWLGALKTVQGEFNPYFGSARWLQERRRVTVPLTELHYSLFHREYGLHNVTVCIFLHTTCSNRIAYNRIQPISNACRCAGQVRRATPESNRRL